MRISKQKFKYVEICGEIRIYLGITVKVAMDEEIDPAKAQTLLEELTPDDWFQINPGMPDVETGEICDIEDPADDDGVQYVYKNDTFYNPDVFAKMSGGRP
jgi:hypothetical protein